MRFQKLPVNIIFLGLISFFSISCHRISDKSTITIKIAGGTDKKVSLYQVVPDSIYQIKEGIPCRNGEAEFNIEPHEMSFYIVKEGADDLCWVAADKGEALEINFGNQADRINYSVSGSTESKILRDYSLLKAESDKKMDSLRSAFIENRSLKEFPIIRKKIDSLYRDEYRNLRNKTLLFIKSHIRSVSSILIANSTLGDVPLLTKFDDWDLFSELDSALTKQFQGNLTFKEFHKEITSFKKNSNQSLFVKRSSIQESQLPEIDLSDIRGVRHSIKSVGSNALLIYCRSPWDKAQTESNVSLTGLYNQFHDLGFEIFSISFDTDQDAWMKATKNERVAWIQVNDASGLKSDILKKLRIKQLPALILLDRNKKVIAYNPTIPELKALLLSRL